VSYTTAMSRRTRLDEALTRLFPWKPAAHRAAATPVSILNGRLDLQNPRETGQVARAPCLNQGHVLQPARAKAPIIQSRLDGHHAARRQLLRDAAKPRQFMDIQPQPVPVPWKNPCIRPLVRRVR